MIRLKTLKPLAVRRDPAGNLVFVNKTIHVDDPVRAGATEFVAPVGSEVLVPPEHARALLLALAVAAC